MTALEVGLLQSVAWREEGELRVALHLPGLEPGAPLEIRFRDGSRRVRRQATVAAASEGSLAEVVVPAAELADGLWGIAVRAGDAESVTPLEARLLVRPGLPVALLPGPPAKSRMPAPPPRTRAPSPPPRARRFARRVMSSVRRRLRRP